jgi:hypothetical protein
LVDAVHALEVLLQVVFTSKDSFGRPFTVAVAGIAAIRDVGLLFVNLVAVDTFAGARFVLTFRCANPLVEHQVHRFFVAAPVTKIREIGDAKCALVDPGTLVRRSSSSPLSQAEDLFPARFEGVL